MLLPFTNSGLLGYMKRDFYLANEVKKNNYEDIIKKKVLFELYK